MARVHVSDKGPGICKAKSEDTCPMTLDGVPSRHFDNPEEAQAAYEKYMEAKSSLVVKKDSKEELRRKSFERAQNRIAKDKQAVEKIENYSDYDIRRAPIVKEVNSTISSISDPYQYSLAKKRVAKALSRGISPQGITNSYPWIQEPFNRDARDEMMKGWADSKKKAWQEATKDFVPTEVPKYLNDGQGRPVEGAEDFKNVIDYSGVDAIDTWDKTVAWYSPSQRKYFWSSQSGCSCDYFAVSSVRDLQNGSKQDLLREIKERSIGEDKGVNTQKIMDFKEK